MYLMYVDESGDKGLTGSPTRYFVLSGLVIHELRWHDTLAALISFRQRMRATFGLKLREEIHCGSMLTRPGALARIKRNDRLTIIRHFLDELAAIGHISLINVRVDKQGKPAGYDPFTKGWEALIQRFENTINHRKFAGPANPDDKGIIYLLRRYRRPRIASLVSKNEGSQSHPKSIWARIQAGSLSPNYRGPQYQRLRAFLFYTGGRCFRICALSMVQSVCLR